MVRSISLYIEGDDALRRGFKQFLSSIYNRAREKGIAINLKFHGSRDETYKAFRIADSNGHEVLLLVDSEEPLRDGESPAVFLQRTKSWNKCLHENSFLMIECMEAWIIADPEALRNYYGKGFEESALPKNPCVEQVAKRDLEFGLKEATRRTSKKEYHKTRHAAELLSRLDVDKVRKACPSCDLFFHSLLHLLSRKCRHD